MAPDSLYPNIITAVGAVAGAIAGTYFTGKSLRDLERQKINRQEQQEHGINIRLRRAIYGELLHLSDKLANLIKYSDSDTFAEASIMLKADSDYLSLPLEKRAAMYDAEELDLVESGYKTFESFRALYNIHYERYKNGELGADHFKSILQIPTYKSFVDNALQRLEKDRGVDIRKTNSNQSKQDK